VLRREMERAGHRYRTRSDTETILHLYETYGPRCVDRLQGMFAFAVWDRRERRRRSRASWLPALHTRRSTRPSCRSFWRIVTWPVPKHFIAAS
jgi:asparagine synthase (glutamine-hydrolysing)